MSPPASTTWRGFAVLGAATRTLSRSTSYCRRSRRKANGLVLVSARGTFRSGSTISKANEYRIHLRTEGADKVWLIYHEKNDAPVTLVSGKSIGSGHGIKYPDDVQKGVKIDTKAAFVTFEVRMQREGQVSRKYYVFGVE